MPHETVWIEYPDIESTCKELDAPPTGHWPNGEPYYTLPMIYDPNTQKRLVDSADIAKYLDETYPESPTLFPAGTDAFQAAALDVISNTIALPVFKIVSLSNCHIFVERSAIYFKKTREVIFGRPLEGIATPALWEELESGLAKLKGWLEKNGEGKDRLLMGDIVTFADLQIASILRWTKVADVKAWDRLSALHGGKWKEILEQYQEYEQVHVYVCFVLARQVAISGVANSRVCPQIN